MSLMCEYCNKNFNSKSNLTRHQKTTKSCIKIQKEKFNENTNIIKISYSCCFCEKKFTTNQTLKSHTTNCPVKVYKDKFEKYYNTILLEKNELLSEKDKIIDLLKNQLLISKTNIDCLEKHSEKIKEQNDISSLSYISELQDKIQEIALTAICQKNEDITKLIKKYVKKQPRKQYNEKNVIYILTTPSLRKDRRYILGKAKNLTNRLSTYNKTDEHEVVFYIECKDEEVMNILEPLVFKKISEYREQANRERFVLPKNKNIDFFIETIKECFKFLK